MRCACVLSDETHHGQCVFSMQRLIQFLPSFFASAVYHCRQPTCTRCDAWHAILQADITRIRQVYDAFLKDFPLCFGYWKKYADAELKHTSVEAAVRVYERGVAAIAYSADLWGQYAVFKQDKGFSPGAVIR